MRKIVRSPVYSPIRKVVASALGQGVGVFTAGLKVFGDSTAREDGRDTVAGGWSTIVSGDVAATLSNSGVSSQSIADCLTGVQADTTHRNWVTVLMDNANVGETAAGWLAAVAQIVALQPNILIWPQCGVTDGSMSGGDLTRMADINAGIIANWPNNTFDAVEQAALIAALSNANTRGDGLHRNDVGQAVEALFASAWLVRKGWRAERPEATALAARMSGSLTTKRRGYINAVIERLVATGYWALTDAYYCEAQFEEAAANLNWVSSSFPLTKVGTVAFVADRGHTGDGSTGVMSTGFDPAVAPSPKWAQNSAGVHLYHLTTPAESKRDISSTSNTSGALNLSTRNADDSLSYQINNATTQFGGGGVTGAQSRDLVRRDATNIYPGLASSEFSAIAAASVAPAGGVILLGGLNFNTKQRAFASIGGGWSAEQKKRRYYAETAYLKAVGASV